MVTFFIIVISILIMVVDLISRRIPNRLTFALFLLLLLKRDFLPLSHLLQLITAIVIIGLLGKFGMGDIKLLLALSVAAGRVVVSSFFLIYLCLTALALVLFNAIRTKGLRGQIPFAPAILLPFLARYLAM
jgi:Flp pilus assembly protein protease CpaA